MTHKNRPSSLLRACALHIGLLLGTGLAVSGCDSGSDMKTQDMSQAASTCCGDPGDTGNTDGIGKYCTKQSDCAGKRANICSNINDTPARTTSFCTIACDPMKANDCGDGASCTKDSGTGFYGCVPTKCVTTPKPGCAV